VRCRKSQCYAAAQPQKFKKRQSVTEWPHHVRRLLPDFFVAVGDAAFAVTPPSRCRRGHVRYADITYTIENPYAASAF